MPSSKDTKLPEDAIKKVHAIVDEYLSYTPRSNERAEIARTKLTKALEYAFKIHGNDTRMSGDTYIEHLIGSTEILMLIQPDFTTIVATILHDIMSYDDHDFTEIEDIFGKDVISILASIKRIGNIRYLGEQGMEGRLQRTFVSIIEDVRTIFVKFAERIHNLQVYRNCSNKEKMFQISKESLYVYAPIAARIGIYEFKELLENEAFRNLFPTEYTSIAGQLAEISEQQHKFLTKSVEEICEVLGKKYAYNISYRIKKPYSIHKKMQKHRVTKVGNLHDIFAVRIVTNTIEDCYAILGEIHGKWRPLPDSMKDYIATPKPNGYQSLHTTVVGLYDDFYKKPTEIQVRTNEMDLVAQYGKAAHFSYKDTLNKDIDEDWVSYLRDAVSRSLENADTSINLHENLVPTTIFAFTPKGDVKELPHGATPLDFAYAIHTNVGHTATGARLNGKMVTLDSAIQNGDVVEIVTDKNSGPSLSWLDFVKTSKAKTSISIEVKKTSGEHDRIIERGKKMLDEYLLRTSGEGIDKNLSALDIVGGAHLSMKQKLELVYQIGNFTRRPSTIFSRIRTEHTEKKEVTFKAPELSLDVIVGGQKDLEYKKANCCQPKAGDSIVGVVRVGGKIMIHKANCKRLERANPDRILPAYWETLDEPGKVIKLSLLFSDSPGVLRKLTKVLYEMDMNIIDLESRPTDKSHSQVLITLEVNKSDNSAVDRLFEHMRYDVPEFELGEIVK